MVSSSPQVLYGWAILALLQAQALLNILGFLLVWLAVWGTIAFPLFNKFQWRPFRSVTPEKKLLLILPLYLLAPFMIWGANTVLGQNWSELGIILTPQFGRSLLSGVGIAIVGLGLLLLIKIGCRLVSFEPPDPETNPGISLVQKGLTLLGLLGLGLWVGGIEEWVFRGWMQTQLELAFSPWFAASLGSAVFAVAHLMWDGRSGLWQQPGLWGLGWVLVVARWADGGSIALAWGLHAGWVWGLAAIAEILHPQVNGQKPLWLVGRPDQPLTSVLDLLLLGTTAGWVWWGYSSLPPG